MLTEDKYRYRRTLLGSSDPSEALRIDSSSLEGGILISTAPKDKHSTIRKRDHFRERLRMRFGLMILYIEEGLCQCEKTGPYKAHVDRYGFHCLSGCNRTGARQENHDHVLGTLMELCRASNLTCRPEDHKIMMSEDPSCLKRLDIIVDNFEGSTSLGFDVSLVDCRTARYRNSCSLIAGGKPAADRETYKIDKYRAICQRQNCLFEPFVLEAHGRMGPRTRDIFETLVQRVHVNTNLPLSYLKNYWRSRIVMAMHQSASANVQSRNNDAVRRRQGWSLFKKKKEEACLPCEMVDADMWGRDRH